MGVRKSGYVTDPQGRRHYGQSMYPEHRERGIDGAPVAAASPPSQSWSEAVERRQAAAALERAASTPVPDDNMMSLRRRMTGS